MTVNTLKMYVGAGIILARQDEVCGYRFLLLKGRATGIWSFSKGHPERVDRDSALRTAARETFEETGLSAGVDYTIYGNSVRFGKRPYWLGILTADAQDIRMSLREHSAYAWLTLEEIGSIRSNLDVRAWVQKSQRGEFQRLLTISNGLQQRS
jgi:8-oxo-dGTP pyrophosphatase MutT (NUDIX family)